MWDRILSGGVLVVGAFILFIAFVTVLFIIEKREESQQRRDPRRHVRIKKQTARTAHRPLYIVRKPDKAA